MASLSSSGHDACGLMKQLRVVYEGRKNGGNWGMANHFERTNLFAFFIAMALFTSLANGHQYDSISQPPVHSYYQQAVSSPPSPWAFSIQLQSVASPPSPQAFSIQPLQYPPPSAPSSPSSSSDSTSSPPPPLPSSLPLTSPGGEKKTSMGIIVGPIVGGIIVVALIGAAVAWKYKKKPANADPEQPGGHDGSQTTQRSPMNQEAPLIADKESRSRAAVEAPGKTDERKPRVATIARHFTYNEILSITGNFREVIGEGGSAIVYSGRLQEDGLKVAVKKLKGLGSQIGNFLEEINILMRIHHRYLVSLVGVCEEQDEIILVSEYMANGNLSELLKARASELTWRKRLQIALNAATGLEYLHTGCNPSVIHRDINPRNILLNEKLEAKLADFGLSKAGAVDGSDLTSYHTKIAGTVGYIDPEYLYTQTLTKKSDVYSFGVVLFELITGKSAVVITEKNEKLHLTNWVMPMLIKGDIEGLLDPLLKGHCNVQSVWEVAAIAKTATQQPSGRPDMPEIVSTLNAALRMEASWADTPSVSDTNCSQSSFREVPQNPAAR